MTRYELLKLMQTGSATLSRKTAVMSPDGKPGSLPAKTVVLFTTLGGPYELDDLVEATDVLDQKGWKLPIVGVQNGDMGFDGGDFRVAVHVSGGSTAGVWHIWVSDMLAVADVPLDTPGDVPVSGT